MRRANQHPSVILYQAIHNAWGDGRYLYLVLLCFLLMGMVLGETRAKAHVDGVARRHDDGSTTFTGDIVFTAQGGGKITGDSVSRMFDRVASSAQGCPNGDCSRRVGPVDFYDNDETAPGTP